MGRSHRCPAPLSSFARADLEKGINLAAEFPENPFSQPTIAIDQAIARKQVFETAWVKDWVPQFAKLRKDDDDKALGDALDALLEQFMIRQARMTAAARALVVPVTHTLAITRE